VSCIAVIPIKASGAAKSRLAGALDVDARERLVSSMLAHVVRAAQAAPAIDEVRLLGPSRLGLPETIPLLPDPGGGLNPAVQATLARLASAADAPDRLLILFADLPEVTPAELDRLVMVPAGSIAIAPDRHHTGTNALSLPLPAARDFRFAFGSDSYARHRAEAERIGLAIEPILTPGLERDVDEPADLPEARAALQRL
jgi:2-phospho-L-lactate/phosphoenolpyruvate guanylyltransferase